MLVCLEHDSQKTHILILYRKGFPRRLIAKFKCYFNELYIETLSICGFATGKFGEGMKMLSVLGSRGLQPNNWPQSV